MLATYPRTALSALVLSYALASCQKDTSTANLASEPRLASPGTDSGAKQGTQAAPGAGAPNSDAFGPGVGVPKPQEAEVANSSDPASDTAGGNDAAGAAQADAAKADAAPLPDSGDMADAGTSFSQFVYVGTGDWSGSEPGRIAVYRLERDGAMSFVERVDAGGIGAFMAADTRAHRLYVADETQAVLRQFGIDPLTGRLSAQGSVSVTGNPVYITLDSAAATLLTANYSDGLTRVFALSDAGIGSAPSDSESTGSETHSIVLTPDDAFAYVCSKGSETISGFAFDATTHALTSLSPTTVAHPGGPRHAAMSTDGRFLYVVSENANTVIVYRRAVDGTLSVEQSIERLPPGESGAGADIQISPRGQLYVSNRAPSNTVAVYDIDAATGQLSPLEHEPAGGQTPRNLAIDPAGRFLLVGNRESRNVVVFEIEETTGSLTQRHVIGVDGSPFFVGVYRL